MAYASVQDMVNRFGAAEMIRASTPDGVPAVAVVDAPIQQALDDASALIDTYLRQRYSVPLDVAPPEIARACCMLARYDLSLGGERIAGEQVVTTRDGVVAWLNNIAKGIVLLDLQQVAPGNESFATFSARPATFSDQPPAGGCGGFFTSGGVPYGGGPL